MVSMQALGRPCRRSNKLHPGCLGGPTRYRGLDAGDDRGCPALEPLPHCITPVLKLLQNIFFFEKYVLGAVVNKYILDTTKQARFLRTASNSH